MVHLFKWFTNLFRKKKMAEFASLDNSGSTIPSASPGTDRLSLTVPGDVLTGTSAGYQLAGSPNLVIDSVNNRIIVNNTSAKNVLTLGKVTTTQLGLSVKNNSTNTNALFVGQNTDNSLGLSTLDASGNAILFAGSDAGGNNVVKVAKTGFDARTASASNLLFNSAQDVLKVVNIYTASLGYTLNSGTHTYTTTIPHNLGFTPAYLCNITVDGGLLSLLSGIPTDSQYTNTFTLYSNGASSLTPLLTSGVTVNSTSFTFYVQTSGFGAGQSYTNNVKIYALQEAF